MTRILFATLGLAFIAVSCKKNDDTPAPAPAGKDINAAAKVSVDRFSATAGHLFVRSSANGLPAANAPVSFDAGPFITQGLDRTGAPVKYYNFDIQSGTADDIYVFFKAGSSTPVVGQNNVIPTIPGDAGYNDFWLVNKVTVPDNYVPNSLTSEAEVLASGYQVAKTTMLVNCPVVPFGSTANRSYVAGTGTPLTLGWYRGNAVAYFSFGEAPLTSPGGAAVPMSPIYVMFNDNAAGPASGFRTEPNSAITHNVLATLPGDAGYSPLWSVRVINNSYFAGVSNLATAAALPWTPAGADVNCPVTR